LIIEEAQVLLTSQHYREPMAKIIRVLRVHTHIVALVGTCPPQLHGELCKITGISNWDVIRMPSTRANIQYAVVTVPADNVLDAAADYVLERIRAGVYGPNDKAMIFCRTKYDAAIIAAKMGTTAYTSETTPIERSRIYDDWTRGDQRTMVCSTILNYGINEQVLDVVHADVSYNLIDHVQAQNRAGRGGLPARAVLFIAEGRAPISDPAWLGADLLVPWAQNVDDCRRIVPSLFMDGAATTCMDLPKALLCDNCSRKLFSPPPAGLIPTPVATATTTSTLPPSFPSPSDPAIFPSGPRFLQFTPTDKGKGRAYTTGPGDVFAPGM
jgi:hypothetical protein